MADARFFSLFNIFRMILLSNASAVYSELQRMREIVHESHEYFSEYMRLHIPQEILSRLELVRISMFHPIKALREVSVVHPRDDD